MCRLPWLLPFLLAACALSPPEAMHVLDDGASDAHELERTAAAALARSREARADADAALAATKLLFQAADLRLQRGALAALDGEMEPSLGEVLAADDRVAADVRESVLSLATAGLECADRALAVRPSDVGSQLHRGLHLSLVAWANGPVRSLMAGHGGRIVAAIEAAVAADATFDHGAPLRLQGRFRGKAPWPYGDLGPARTALERAVAQAPIVVNHLFLGDVLWAAGEREPAAVQWRAATTAGSDESTRWSTPLLVELARRRLAALAR